MFEREVPTRQFKNYVVGEVEPEEGMGSKGAAAVAGVH